MRRSRRNSHRHWLSDEPGKRGTMDTTEKGCFRRFLRPLVLFDGPDCTTPATEADQGRTCCLEEEVTHLVERIRLVEDGYVCFIRLSDLQEHTEAVDAPEAAPRLSLQEIRDRTTAVIEKARSLHARENVYRWGGTIGPDVDCSGLVQLCYRFAGIWLPRDAFQQAEFTERVPLEYAFQGDLLFFGKEGGIDHVGIYLGEKNGIPEYIHSSGSEHGNNGIGINLLTATEGMVALHYYKKFLFCARVVRSVQPNDRFACRTPA